MIQGGVRVENTVSEGISDGLKFDGSDYIPSLSSFRRSYTDLFPGAAVTFNKNPKKQWSLNYSRRIDRPAYQDLNPFEFKLDEYTFMKGNINLRPQYTNSFGITHIYNYKLNMSLNYSHVKDLFTSLIDTTEKSKAFVSRKNLATQDIVNLSVSYPYQHKSYSLFTSLSSNYSKYKADFGTGRKVHLDAVGFSLFVQNSLKFKKTWTAELSGFFNAPTIYQGSFKGRSIYNYKECSKATGCWEIIKPVLAASNSFITQIKSVNYVYTKFFPKNCSYLFFFSLIKRNVQPLSMPACQL
jgi:iron complex outermembrane recepter protein